MSKDTMTICTECGESYRIGEYPFCPHGRPHGGLGISAIHTSERAVIYRNPRTGEHRTPASKDLPMPAAYVKQGYVREELTTARDVRRFEKETGTLHERSHYDPGSGRADRDNAAEPEPYRRDPEVTKRLVQALR